MKQTVALSLLFICLGFSSVEQGEQPIPDDVVLSEDPVLGEEAWVLSAEPSLVLGSDGTDGSGIFLWKVREVLRFDDGRLLVIQDNVNPILMLDSDGKYLRGMSREGEGPAEFQGIRSVEVLPDGTLAAWGSVNRQIVLFDTLGGYLRTISHRAAIPELLTRAQLTHSLGLVSWSGQALVGIHHEIRRARWARGHRDDDGLRGARVPAGPFPPSPSEDPMEA